MIIKDKNGVDSICYDIKSVWYGIKRRCDPVYQNKTYEGCSICEEWLNYENFLKWYTENYYHCSDEKLEVDKDLLVSGNRIYSPSTCCFLPRRLNNAITTYTAFKYGLPQGVTRSNNRADRYNVRINFGGNDFSKTFDSVDEAFEFYKIRKEKYIKQVADFYREYLPQNLYELLADFDIKR